VHALDTELRARDLRSRVHIEVDGGLNEVNVHEAAKQGANAIVAGSSIFGSKDPAATIQHMRTAVNAHF
jgi:ribulose-phosphate 3-epimerase